MSDADPDVSSGSTKDRASSLIALNKLKNALELELCTERGAADEPQETEETEEALQLMNDYMCSSSLSSRGNVCRDLAAWLWGFWTRCRNQDTLEAWIEVEGEMRSHMDQETACAELTDMIRKRYRSFDDSALLSMVIKLQQDVLNLRPLGHPLRGRSCMKLAEMQWERYMQTGDITLLDNIIELEEEALCLCPSSHADRARRCLNLALSLTSLHEQTSEHKILERVIALQQEARDLYPVGHRGRAAAVGCLAASLRTRYDHNADRELLDKVIAFHTEALSLCPTGHPDRYGSCLDLAISLRARYRQSGNSAALDEAVELDEEALSLRPPGHQDRAVSCANLAFGLTLLFERSGDNALLERAFELNQEAHSLLLPGDVNYANSRANFAVSLVSRYHQTSDLALLDRAIKIQQEVINLCPVGHQGRARACSNLAVSLSMCYDRTRKVTLLDEAIGLQQEVLDLRPQTHPRRSKECANLAACLKDRYEQTQDQAILEECTKLNQEALLLSALDSPDRWRYSHELAVLNQLVSPSPDIATTVEHLRQVFNAPSYDDIHEVLNCAVYTLLSLDMSLMSQRQQQILLEIHADAINVVTLAASHALDPSTQLQHVLRGSRLGPAALRLAIQLNEIPTGLQLLERARGVIWLQMLHMRDPQLERVPSDLAAQLQSLIYSAPTPGRGLDDTSFNRQPQALVARSADYAHRNRLREVVRQIRLLPGLEDFMRGPSKESLLDVAARNLVVVMITSKSECHALIMTAGDPHLVHVPLPGISPRMLHKLTFEGLIGQKRGSHSAERGIVLVTKTSVPHTRLARLWRGVVKPIIDQLGFPKSHGRARPRLHWCPTGPFAFLPLHAAGLYEGPNQECCSDYIVSSYTPTLTALIQARKYSQLMFAPQQIKLMTVAVESTRDVDMPRLHYAMSETRAVTSIVQRAGVIDSFAADTATKAEVLARLRSSQVVHFACHGVQHQHEPHKSHFCLGSDRVTVAELMNIDLNDAFLAFLSACETAKGDQKHVDEVIHLAASMLFAGFKSIVATMWSMNDADGPSVAKEFYENLFKGTVIDVDSVPYALDAAVSTLRAKGIPPERWATFIHMGA